MTILSLIALVFIMSSNTLLACWAAPPPIVWHKPKGKPYHYSVTREGKVTITEAKDHEKVLWSTNLMKYSGIFSEVYVVEDGNRIVQVQRNHRVRKLSDIAVISITKDGKSISFDASEFIDKLQPGSEGNTRMSTDPQCKWLGDVKKVDKDGITLVNALGKEKSANWKGEKRVEENPTLSMKHIAGWTSEVLSEFILSKDGIFIYREKKVVLTGKIPEKEIKTMLHQIAAASDGPNSKDAGYIQFRWIAKDGTAASKDYTSPSKEPCKKLFIQIKALVEKYSKKNMGAGKPKDKK